MKSKNLVLLVAVVIVVFAYIMLVERHRPTTDEVTQTKGRVLRGFDRDAVVEINIQGEAGAVRLVKNGDLWQLVEPIDYPADSSVVSSTLGSLANLEADRRLTLSEIDIADYGLDEPVAEVSMQMSDGAEIVLSVGGEMPLGSNRALRLSGSDEVLVAAGWFVSDLERTTDEWRSRDVVEIGPEDVASIEIFTDDDRIRAVRMDDRWQLEEPLQDVADREHLRNLVSELNSLRIEEFLDDDVDLSELGLVTPEYEITVVRADGAGPLRLLLGATRDGANGLEVACRRGDDLYFWAADRVRTRLAKAPVLWRSAEVAPFETWEATGLRLERGEETINLSGGDVPWQFADGVEANLTAVQDRLTRLADLEATDFDLMAPLTAEMGKAEIVFESDDDTVAEEVLTFTFFHPLAEGGRAMVRVSNRSNLMAVDAADVDAILGDLALLRPILDSEVDG